MEHITVLKHEAVDGLNIRENGIYVDGTLGGGGHSELILERIGPKGILVAIDQDDFALEVAKKRLNNDPRVRFVKNNFANIKEVLEQLGIARIDGVILDLGVSSFQFDDMERGFSYREDAILDMRMDKSNPLTAHIVLNTYSEEDLARIFWEYGEESYNKPIARAIVARRGKEKVESTLDLVEIIKSVLPDKVKRKKGHPAKKVFQSLRIEVNKELTVLKEFLENVEELLDSKGRISIITFHSLEDRQVKLFLKNRENPCTCPKEFPVCICGKKPTMKIITRKPQVPKEEEIIKNNRARSAKLRIGERRERENHEEKSEKR